MVPVAKHRKRVVHIQTQGERHNLPIHIRGVIGESIVELRNVMEIVFSRYISFYRVIATTFRMWFTSSPILVYMSDMLPNKGFSGFGGFGGTPTRNYREPKGPRWFWWIISIVVIGAIFYLLVR
jgi:hypothetical protein